MGRVAVTGRFQCQPQDLRGHLPIRASLSLTRSQLLTLRRVLPPCLASRGPTALSSEMLRVGRAIPVPPTGLLHPLGWKQTGLLWTLPLRPASATVP